MGRFNGNDGDQDAGRRKPLRHRGRRPRVESLENRTLMAGNLGTPPAFHPANGNFSDIQNGPLAIGGSDLVKLYQDYLAYQQSGGNGTFSPSDKFIRVQGTSAGLDIRGYGDPTTFAQSLRNLGMNVENVVTQPNTTIVSGLLPLNLLPQVVTLPQIVSMQPIYKPILAAQGIASDQAEQTLRADVAKTTFNVTGAGTTVGVISDSFGDIGNGLADSVRTGDLPPGNRVTVLQDFPGQTDEGRGMAEGIYDIAQGVNIAFNTGDASEANFANAIINLARFGSQVIVDDLRYFAEPVFQDGIVAQAVNNVVQNNGVTYFSAAGNQGSQGYQSTFRGVDATVPGVGAGRFFNFNPGAGAAATSLQFTENFGNAPLVLQWDDPFYTSNGVKTSLNLFVLDANNNIVYQSTSNAIATQTPVQIAGIINPGTYSIVVQVASGPDPGRIFLADFSDDAVFTHPFGTAGGVTYQTTGGHDAAVGAIGTGAVPWFGAPPYLNANPVASEPFSSFGPVFVTLNPDGSRKAAVETRLQPVVSGVDGGSTSFFGSPPIDTSNPYFPGQPKTPTNENTQPNNPSFFGTSFAAPSLAAVAALMRQLSPTSTSTDIRNAMIASATPLNGTPKGTWDVQGGFGLVDAPRALAAIDQLRVTRSVPGGGQAAASPPTTVTLTFSQPVDFTTVQASDLKITGPNGVTVIVGNPVAVDDPRFPTVIQFPITIVRQPGVLANGTYFEGIAAGAILSSSGKPVAAFTDSFSIASTIHPQITSTSFNSRFIRVTFNEPIDPSTLNSGTLFLVRANNPNGAFNDPSNIIVTSDPRTRYSYDPSTNTETIDLSALDQTELPTDHYALIGLSPTTNALGAPTSPGITDIVGNPLDGAFSGQFPTGNGGLPNPNNPAGPKVFFSFVQDIGVRVLTAPIFNNVALAPQSDSGVKGDQNTNVTTPTFNGQIGANFLGAVANLVVLVEFNGLHGGRIDLGPGANGRGFAGNYDVLTVTDSSGRFTVKAPANLPDGFNRVRFLVIGQADAPPLPGLSTTIDQAFRVDTTRPILDTTGTHPSGASLPQGARISTLTNLSLFITDPISPISLSSPFAVPVQLSINALDPATANNISNYSLYQQTGTNAQGQSIFTDRSAFILTATFVSTTARRLTSDPYTGRVDLTFGTGLPQGHYLFVAHTTAPGTQGLTDSAANPLLGEPTGGDYFLGFDFQPQPVYITSVKAKSPDGTLSDPRSFFEVSAPGTIARAEAPPNQFIVDFSNPLKEGVDYSNMLQLIASADTAGGASDGNFGDFGIANTGNGYSRVLPPGTTVTLTNSIPGAIFGQPGFDNRLVLTLPSNFTLTPDYYRLYIPNSTANGTAVIDQFNNQLDGEFLGDKTASGTFEDLLPNGQYRQGLSGDSVAGGAFVTGYVVVPNGNIIYARPDYQDDPFLNTDDPDGSLAKPFPVLAPEAAPNAVNGGNLNAQSNFGTGFNQAYNRAGTGHFDRSALFAAQQASTRGPVVVVALPGTLIRDPLTGLTTQRTFVLQAPAGVDPIINDASTSVPALTTLVFAAGSTLKLQNAALFAQNQGSAIEVEGGPNPSDKVTFTSYADDSIGGDTNADGNSTVPRGGDWGGLVFRNFDQTNRQSLFQGQIQTTGNPSLDQRLKGPGGADAISGADPVMSVIDNALIRYAGGAVPQTIGTRYDAVTLQNSRPAITNTAIRLSGGSQAAISGDLDAFREDEIARGPLIRRDDLTGNSLNGIFVRAELNGVAEPTNAINYPFNPSTLGGARNFTFDDPYPYLLTSRLTIGSVFLQETGGSQASEPDRMYIQPGMMFKLAPGAGIEIQSVTQGNQSASINVGDRTYINGFDANPGVAPVLSNGQPNPAFHANATGDARVLFTSIFDNTASTSFFDPVTQTSTQIVAPIDSANSRGLFQPTPGNVPSQARWGSITIFSPAIGVIDEADVRYGGGFLNTTAGTTVRSALDFAGAGGFGQNGTGTHVSTTNNTFSDNADVPIDIEADGLFAGDPLRPLQSGNPFFRGNVFLRNGLNGLGVEGSTPGIRQDASLSVNSVWDDTDLVYVLRRTIALAPFVGSIGPRPITTGAATEPKPTVSLTIQSTLPGTILANGQQVGRPGESAIVKLLGTGPNVAFTTTPNVLSEDNEGAGFVSGMDNGVDPQTDSLIDIGTASQIRFLGIGGNETTGQQRVPVIITSVHDSTVGRTVNGIAQMQVIDGDTIAPAPGDGGNIIFGSHTLTDYNLYDPRDGNLIDNTDIRYISRIEQIGGGIISLYDTTGKNSFDPKVDDPYSQKLGLSVSTGATGGPQTQTFGTQYNGPNSMTVSNSNLSSFRDFGFFAHPGFGGISIPENYNGTIGRAPIFGQPTQTFFVNNTFVNMPTAINLITENTNDTSFESPAQMVMLNNTFYSNANGITTTAPAFNGQNGLSHANILVMNNIFSNTSGTAVTITGQGDSSQLQYNLFFSNGTDVNFSAAQFLTNGAGSNLFPVFGNPAFVDPAHGNFNLGPNSAAIDSSRSEIGPIVVGDILFPAVTQILGPQGGVRNEIGRSNPFGGDGFPPSDQDFVTLPGYPIRAFADQFVPAIPGTPGSFAGPASNPATFNYAPIGGERDQLGYLRQDDPIIPNVGFGSRPFFDIGAFEYRQLFPPHITGVTATFTDPASPTGSTTKNIYQVGGIAGTNLAPTSINIQFDGLIDINTINASTILLAASGGDGLFGNGNSAADRLINLAGKLAFDPVTHILTVNLANSGLILANDEYRISILGSGSNVVRDPNGNALDGEDLDANGNQRPLPSGDGFPGGNFQVTFTVDTNPPAIVPGSFNLDTSADSNYRDLVTDVKLPTFSGNITDIFPPANFLQGSTVHIDISSKGDGVFDLIDAGVGTTDVNGHFSIQLTTPLPDSPYTVGPDGILANDYTKKPPTPAAADDTGRTLARVRVVDQSGNVSLPVTAPFSTFAAQGAAAAFIVDTRGPRITGISPPLGSLISPSANGVPITIAFNENVDPASFNANSIQVVRSGGDGVFGNGNDVVLTIDPNSLVFRYLRTPSGAETVTFTVIPTAGTSLANDVYNVTLKGTGSNPVTDTAGNPLDGVFNGNFPTGNGGPGSDFNPSFVVYSPTLVNTIFVGDPTVGYITNPQAAQGTRNNPFPTITAGIAKANTGDIVAVLPGVYNEAVTMKSLVSLFSASASSTDGGFLPGDPLTTIIRAPVPATGSGVTVTASNLTSIFNGGVLNTEINGFTIASSLLFDPTFGPIDTNSIGLLDINSNLLIDRDYFVDSGIGVAALATTTSTGSVLPRLVNNGFIGNINGVLIDTTQATAIASMGQVVNNDFAFNTNGLVIIGSLGNNLIANVANNIFWQNHDLQPVPSGTGIFATVPNKVFVRNNLFSGNGRSQTSPADDAVGVGGGFLPGNLQPNAPDVLGNFTGGPAFVAPRDPRPNGDGPTIFFNDANFDLTLPSAAVDRANPAYAPQLDFLQRPRKLVAGRGFPGTGPADVGAFEYSGSTSTGTGLPVGGESFRVASDSLSVAGFAKGNNDLVAASAAPASVTVSFSANVNRASVTPNDLIIGGDGLNPANPVHATSLSWIDDHTVKFNLTGGYNKSGTVAIAMAANAVTDKTGRRLAGFSDSIRLVAPVAPAAAIVPTAMVPIVSIPVVAPITPVTVKTPKYVPPTKRRGK